MKQYFAPGDKVVERGKASPVMTVLGQMPRSNSSSYPSVEDIYVCKWIFGGVPYHKSYHESQLEYYYDDDILAAIAASRQMLHKKEFDASTTQMSLIHNRRNELSALEGQYLQREKSPLYQKEIHSEFSKAIQKINDLIQTI